MRRFYRLMLGGFVVLGAFAIGAAWIEDVQEDREQALRAVERGRFAPTDTSEMGPMPRELRETSGLGISRAYPGVIWTHNDSGDRPRFFAIDSTATILATFDVEGARARDWEAMELGPCPGPIDASCLYMADVGDNSFARKSVTIYIIEEPDPAAGDAEVGVLRTVSFAYPDGPHDVEALAMAPSGGLIIVTKERSGTPWLFQISPEDVASALGRADPFTLAPGRRLPIGMSSWRDQTSGASLNSTGDVLAVRTYSEIYFFRWPITDEPEQAAETCFLGDLQRQGEAIAFQEDGRLLLTSETTRRQGYLLSVRCAGVGA